MESVGGYYALQAVPGKRSLPVDIGRILESPATQHHDGVNVLKLTPCGNRIPIFKGQQKEVFCRFNREHIEKEEEAKKEGPESLGHEKHTGQQQNEKEAWRQK